MELIRLNEKQAVVISGTTVFMKPMNFDDRTKLIELMDDVDELRGKGKGTKFISALTKKKPEIDSLLTKYVVSIELPEIKEINNELWNIMKYEDYISFIMALFEVSGMKGQKAKN